VIRIRYSSELQPGLHGRVERHGGATFVYLLPGLTPRQRQAALRRMRQQGRMGISPRLPAAQLATALLADRVRAAFGQAGAIVRVHPAGSTLPVMAVSVAITSFLVLSALSVHIVRLPPQAAGGRAGIGSAPGGGAGQPLPGPGGGQPTGPSSGRGNSPSGGTAGPTPAGAPVTSRGASPSTGPSRGSSAGPGAGPSSGPSTGPSSGTTQSPSPVVTPSPGDSTLSSTNATTPPSQPATQQPTPSASDPSTPAPDPSLSSSPAASTGSGNPKGQVCLDVGALGICLGW
jgi:hypothetical protein